MGRGPAKMKFLQNLLPNERIQVEWDVELKCPLGQNGDYLTRYISHLAKDGNKLPLTVADWKYMSSVLIDNVILEVKQIFAYPEVLEHWVRTKVNDRWRDHKFHVKKDAYTKWKSVEERLAHPPDNVVESQWRILVEIWDTDVKKQEICIVNQKNREKQTTHHTTGSKSHAKIAAELGKKLGRRPKRHEVFEVTHTKKKKTEDPDEVLMDPEVAAELKAMKEVEIQASQPGSTIVLQGRHDAYAAVRGRDKGGRVRCLGSGIKPKEYWGEGSSTNPATDPSAEILNLKQQLESTLAELQGATQRIAELEALLVAHDEPETTNTAYQGALDRIAELEAQLRTYNVVTPLTDADIRNSP